MAKQPLTDDIVSKVKIALRPEIDAALTNASARLENSFSKGLSAVSDEISTLARNFAHFSDQAQQQLTVQEKELEELRKFNANAESHRNEQREEMKQLHEMMGRLVAKLDPK